MFCYDKVCACVHGALALQVKAPQKTKMSNKEKKALKKLRDARRARGEEVTDSEED
jgi:elongation factor 3